MSGGSEATATGGPRTGHDDAELLRGQLERERRRADYLLDVVIPIGVALSHERDFSRLLERILLEAMALCHADGGTLYLRSGDGSGGDCLEFVMLRTESLGLALGGTTGREIAYPSLPLHDAATGEPNHHYVATHAALCGTTVNIPDAYRADGFDFSGPRAFDRKTGYRSTSFLVVPLKNGEDRVIGVIQLINAQAPETGAVIAFDPDLQRVVESLAALAGVALESYLRMEGLRQEVRELRIEIDETKKARQVAEITETDYFQQLQQRAKDLRTRARPRS